MKRCQGRNSRPKHEGKTSSRDSGENGVYYIAFCACSACFFYTTHDHIPSVGIAHSWMSPPKIIINQSVS